MVTAVAMATVVVGEGAGGRGRRGHTFREPEPVSVDQARAPVGADDRDRGQDHQQRRELQVPGAPGGFEQPGQRAGHGTESRRGDHHVPVRVHELVSGR